MAFDLCQHQIIQLLIKVGQSVRELRGEQEEKNISILHREALEFLKMPLPVQSTSKEADHLPFAYEVTDQGGKFVIPRKDCPQCFQKGSVVLAPLCQSCKEAEGGKYKSIWTCTKCSWKEKMSKAFIRVLEDLGIASLPEGDKRSLGIKTMTDQGLV